MSLTDILNAVTIVTDCSSWNISSLTIAVLLGFISLLGVIALILQIVRGVFTLEMSKNVVIIISTIIVAIGSVLFCCWFNTFPKSLKLFIAANDVSVTELSVYFELDNITSIDENTFLYISPKLEYYGEMLEWYKQSNE